MEIVIILYLSCIFNYWISILSYHTFFRVLLYPRYFGFLEFNASLLIKDIIASVIPIFNFVVAYNYYYKYYNHYMWVVENTNIIQL